MLRGEAEGVEEGLRDFGDFGIVLAVVLKEHDALLDLGVRRGWGGRGWATSCGRSRTRRSCR